MNARVWRNADHDIPVTLVDETLFEAPEGRAYCKVEYEGRVSYVPADELLTVEEAEQSLRTSTATGEIEPAIWWGVDTQEPDNDSLLFADAEWGDFPHRFWTVASATGVIKVKRTLRQLGPEQWKLVDTGRAAWRMTDVPADSTIWLLGIRDLTVATMFRRAFCEDSDGSDAG